ncbi:MAG: MarR family transcriptional regulator [Bacteroidales bacterium]|jgi:DNA-binding MarR family transcriptional regulator|nr:MarR family transcriptional regulator [Bacteroidales bacterium]
MTNINLLNLIYKAHIKISELEKTPHDFGTGELLYSSDIHTIIAIGEREGCNLTELSQRLNISKPGAFKFARKMLGADYIRKEQVKENNKELAFFLTQRGKKAMQAHIEFRNRVFKPLESLQNELNPEEVKIISDYLTSLEGAIRW